MNGTQQMNRAKPKGWGGAKGEVGGGGGVCVSNFRTLKLQLHVGSDGTRVEIF